MSLHVHSEYSSLDGWSTVDEIGDRIQELGCPYCGLTDHGVVAGHIKFDKAMRSRDINPVFGCELYHGLDFGTLKKGARDQAHLIALAMTDEGLRNLWRLVNCTASREKYHHVGRVSNEDIVKYKEGIIFTSACPIGHVPQGLAKGDNTMLDWYLDNLGDQFRIEVTTYPGDAPWNDFDASGERLTPRVFNELLVDAAEERGVAVTYGDDGHYAFPEQWQYHDMYLAAQTRSSIYDPPEARSMWHPEGALCIKSEDDVREALAYLGDDKVEEIILNTHDVGTKSSAHLPEADRPHLPVFVPTDCPWIEPDDERSATELFIDLVEEGIAKRYPTDSKNEAEAWAKAAHECEILVEAGLDHYFLWAWDIFQFCDVTGIRTGPGRGSSAGSIVAYALGITDVDPLHYELYFERFWNAGRADGFPDIDSDFARSKRGDIRQYLIDRLGADKVCSIGTIKRFKPIAVMNKLASACEIGMGELKEVKKIVEEGVHKLAIHGTEQIGWNPDIEPGKVIYVNVDVGDEIQEWIGNSTKRERFIEMCEHTNSRNESYGIHPSGIVIADIDLSDYAPAYLRGGGKKEGIPATQFPMKTIDDLRLVKEDVLGLKTLDTLDEWEKLMEEKGEPVEWSGMDREEYPDEMWDLLEDGFVSGIFQIETPAGKQLCERMHPRSVEDLGVLGAIVRPGPDEWEYIHRMEGRSEVTFAHPMMEPILGHTQGLFVYQEQIIRFMADLGYSAGDADAMRKILGKKQPEKLAALYEGTGEWEGKGWLNTALDKGFEEEAAKKLWTEIEDFASYSFNKSHAISYAIITFRCLYAKWVAPQEFYIACIRTVEHDKRGTLTPQYIKEARRKGIKVLPPHILYSQAECDVYEDNIYFGFGDIKGVSSAGAFLAELRDARGLRVETPDELLTHLEEINDEALKEKKALALTGDLPVGWKSPKQILNEGKVALVAEVGAWDDLMGGWSLKDKQAAEQEYLSVVLTDNTEEVIAANQDIIDNCDDYNDVLASLGPDDEAVDFRIAGIITGVRPTKVKATGASMGIVTVEFGRHELSFACFSNKWGKNKAIFKLHQVGIFNITHSPPTSKRAEGWHFESGRLLNV